MFFRLLVLKKSLTFKTCRNPVYTNYTSVIVYKVDLLWWKSELSLQIHSDLKILSIIVFLQMDVPFRIPKKKQPSDSCSLDMQSPLSRLQDSNTHKVMLTSYTLIDKCPYKCVLHLQSHLRE